MDTKSAMEAERINSFRERAPSSVEQARQYLEAAGWDLNRALELFLDSPEPDSYTPQPTGRSLFLPEKVPSPARSATPPAASQQAATRPKASGSGEKPRMMSVSDLNAAENDSEQAFFTGGEKSGLQVIDPKKDKPSEIVSKVFEGARQAGATAAAPEPTAAAPTHFTGTGRRLGDDSFVAPPPRASAQVDQPRQIKITFWKNGFTVDDGVVRPYADPQNQAFLQDIRNGHVPRELYNGRERVEVDLVDSKDRDWEAPKPVLKPFSGAGKRLGSQGQTLAQIQHAAATATTTSSATPSTTTSAIDPNAPQTTIQIRLSGGERLVAHFNVTQTVGELYDFVRKAKPATPNFVLTTFPNIPLNDKSLTLRDAQLEDAAITQKLA